MTVKVKRAYDPADRSDGTRVLVDRLWPRGMSKQKARIDIWIAPSSELRRWFGHRAERWAQFRRQYLKELRSRAEDKWFATQRSALANERIEIDSKMGSDVTYEG